MGKKDNQRLGPTGIQVFQRTMDNPEDQDELNPRFRKLGEADRNPSTNGPEQGESAKGQHSSNKE